MNRTAGFTIIELMVSLSISSIMILAAIQLYAISIASQRTTQSIHNLDESMRFALTPIVFDVELAGFYGYTHRSEAIVGRAADSRDIDVANDCGIDWSIDLDRPLAGSNDSYRWSCAPYRNRYAPGSDTIVLRHADPTNPTVIDRGRLFIETALTGTGRLFVAGREADLDDTTSAASTSAEPRAIHALNVSGYYVSQTSSLSTTDAMVPSLRVKRLSRGAFGPRIVDEEVQPGIEDIQIVYGVDFDEAGTDGNGIVDDWLTADSVSANTSVLAIRIELTIRSLLREGPAGYRRATVVRTIPIRNASRRL